MSVPEPTIDRICPRCDPDNPAARYADTCAIHRLRESLPVHYFDCDSFQTYNYGLRQGDCDCTATADIEELLALVGRDSSGTGTEHG